MPYVDRPLGKQLASSHSKVIILEGARAVGKTMLMQKELVPRGFSYYSLANESTFLQAKNDIDSWVQNLPRPVIIDEAQRISSLPLAVKETVDALDANEPHFILTGSASLNRKGLDGQNPLTRRSRNFELYPLTQREIRRISRSIVDLLWDAEPDLKYQSTSSDQEIRTFLTVGGFPKYAIDEYGISSDERYRMIRSDIENTLGDSLLPGEKIDVSIATAILRELLTLPGSILNVSRMASELGRDGRTIERYIDIFERRFLIRKLPNLALQAHKQTHSRPKIHPIDSSFSVEELSQAGKDIFGDDRTLMGSVLKSYVVAQVAPEAQWSDKHPSLFYWRQPGKSPKEVDLVMLANNQMVGIEVKAARNFRPSDFDGLEALSNDPRFHRGFLVYTGDKIIRHRENIWAIPITALWSNQAFNKSEVEQKRQISAVRQLTERKSRLTAPDASLFLSYRHSDNDYLGGEIVQLANEIAESYQFLYGATLDVFVDTESIQWDEKWETELDRRIESCNIIMPAVTPGYLKSEACRKELLAFASKADKQKNCHIMPLIWQEVDNLATSTDLVAKTISQHQYEKVGTLRGLSSRSPEYRKQTEKLAKRIHESVLLANKQASIGEQETADDKPDSEGVLEALARCQEEMPAFNKAFNQVDTEFRALTAALEKYPAPSNGNPKELLQWAFRFNAKTKEDVAKAVGSIAEAEKAWAEILPTLSEYTDLVIAAKGAPGGEERIFDTLGMIAALKNSLQLPEETAQAMALMRLLPLISPKLKPFANCFQKAFELIGDIKASVSPLETRLQEATI